MMPSNILNVTLHTNSRGHICSGEMRELLFMSRLCIYTMKRPIPIAKEAKQAANVAARLLFKVSP